MGQYYRQVVVSENGKTVSYIHYGLKLMEHSYFGNYNVNFLCKFILEEGVSRVAWVGDYSEDLNPTLYKKAYSKTADKNEHALPEDSDFTLLQYMLVNHTKKKFLDCRDYYNRCIITSGKVEEWVIHPLPLLTCIGNGRGGGDYRGKHSEEYVGSWCFDKIEIISKEDFYNQKSKYDKYQEITPTFLED